MVRLYWLGAMVCLLLAGCASRGGDMAVQKDPVDCVFNGPCTGAPTQAAPR